GCDVLVARLESDAFSLGTDGNAFLSQDSGDCLGDFRVFPPDQARTLLDDGHFAAEPPVDLGKLQPDVAAANDDEMPRQDLEVEDRGVGQKGNLVDARHVRNGGATTHIDEDPLRLENVVSYTHLVWRFESCVALNDRAPLGATQPAFQVGPGRCDNLVLARLH